MKTVFGLMCVVAVASTLGGCADKTDEPPEATNDEGTTWVNPDTTTPVPEAPRPPAHDSGVAPGTIGDMTKSYQALVSITEDTIRISHASLPGGQTTIAFQNRGKQAHALEVRAAAGGTWRTFPIKPNGTTLLTVSLQSGVYDAYCPLKHGSKTHRDAGVRTQFVVP